MKKKYIILALSPIIIVLELLVFSTITHLIRQPSDLAVLGAVFILILFLAGNFYLLRYIISKL